MSATELDLLWRGSPLRGYRTAVSLHSHTLHSEESLGFIPRYAAAVPMLASVIREKQEKHRTLSGVEIDFSRAYWTPPLAPREAYDLENGAIEALDVAALVSLSDHDNVEAGLLLSVIEQARPIPVSVEWTVPAGPVFFHLGVHNLPLRHAHSILADLQSYTSRPSWKLLDDLLAALDEIDETLVILNHPLWDEAGVGAVEHAHALGRFLERYGDRIHALELNGLRSWKENARVKWVAEHSGHPLISGGDRHGCEPNAILNLTNAATFAEFAAEVRRDRVSRILFLPQYRESLRARMLETIWDIVREYPEHPIGRRRWNDRIFYQPAGEAALPLSAFWTSGTPWPVRYFLGALRVVKSQPLRGALRLALADAQEVCL